MEWSGWLKCVDTAHMGVPFPNEGKAVVSVGWLNGKKGSKAWNPGIGDYASYKQTTRIGLLRRSRFTLIHLWLGNPYSPLLSAFL